MDVISPDGSSHEMTKDEMDRLQASITKNLSERPLHSIIIKGLSGFCPVQGFGTVNDKEFYFRARGQQWTLEVEDKLVAGDIWGDGPYAAGWMPLEEAMRLIAAGLSEYANNLSDK